jgi:O-acetyl-ADP-ribose deacetylase (regulator of RNase III)
MVKKMKIEYRKGNLLDTHYKFILHGLSSKGVMGSGVAKLIRQKWPKAYQDYKDKYDSTGLKLGEVIASKQDDDKIILNAITQEFYGKDDQVYVSYWAIANVIKTIDYVAKDTNKKMPGNPFKIAMPQIGSGLGGGDWKVIEAIIENESKNIQPVVYIL